MNSAQFIQKILHQVKDILYVPMVAVTLSLVGWCILFSLFPGIDVAHAQNTNATIRGQVLDPTGALVPNAQVVIVNQQTNVNVFNGYTDSLVLLWLHKSFPVRIGLR